MSNVVARMQEHIRAQIKVMGHASFPVMGQIPFNYTIGLSDHIGYELILIGLGVRPSNAIINSIGFALRESKEPIKLGVRNTILTELPFVLLPVPEEKHEEYTVQSFNFYDKHQQFLQVVIPDNNDIFPWEEGYDPQMTLRFPVIGTLPS